MRTGKKEILGTLSVSKDTTLSGDLTQRDIQRIENNIMLLGFYRSVDNSKTKYNLDNGMIDELEDLSGIDTDNSLNYEYESTDDYLYPSTQGIDTYTKLMLHGEGAPTITHQITVNGGAQISTAQKKFGTGSIYFDGSGDYLTIPSASEWGFGANDFTIDFWVRFDSLAIRPTFVWRGGTGDGAFGLCWLAGGSNQIYWNHTDGSSWFTYYPTWAPTTNTWYHVAVVKYGTNFDIYVNGTTLQHVTNCTVNVADVSGTIAIGAQNDNSTIQRYLNGYIDEFRVSKNIARWTADFTPPITEYTLDEYTMLLLHGNGTNTSTAIYDSVGNDIIDKNITMNGNARLAYNSKIGTGCAIFDGTGDYISIPDSDDWNFGTNDITIEGYINFNTLANTMFIAQSDGTSDNYWAVFYENSTTTLNFYHSASGSVVLRFGCSFTPQTNIWYHFAVVRNGNTWYIFIDGQQKTLTLATGSYSASISNISGSLYLGQRGDGNYYFTGRLDEVRISKGIARYTSNFTPLTTAFAKDSYTKLLCHFDEDYRDYSDVRGKTLIVNGNTQISTAQYNVGSASLLFDGTDDYLSLTDSSDWDYDLADFTIECYFRISAWNDYATLISHYQNTTGGWILAFSASSANQQLGFWTLGGEIVWADLNTSNLSLNTWYHVAVVRYNGRFDMYINGTSVKNVTKTYNSNTGDQNLLLGRYSDSWAGGYLNGYIDEVRISKGIARYTANFTPSTTPFITDKYTVLLLHGEGTNGSQSIIDSSGLCTTINGDTHIEGSKFGISSYYFDGTGDYLSIPDSDDFYFGTGDFTIDFWFYPTSVSGNKYIYEQHQDSGNDITLYQNNSNIILDILSSSSQLALYTWSNVLTLNTWKHIALVRTGTNIYLFIDGISKTASISTAIGSNSIPNFSSNLVIGAYYNGTANYLNGCLDEFRISKGIARWTTTFTPPTSAYSQNLQNLTIQSTVNNAQTTPPSARLVVFEEDVDTITLNTDLKGWVSRDNGATWSQVTLTNDGSFDSTKQILAGNVDISAQPSGTQVKYKITSHNNKNLKLHGTGLSWD